MPYVTIAAAMGRQPRPGAQGGVLGGAGGRWPPTGRELAHAVLGRVDWALTDLEGEDRFGLLHI